MSRVLVTGATGFIGSQTLEPLRELGFEVIAAGSREADLLEPGGAEALVASSRPSHLLHMAWYAEHGRFWDSYENLRWVEASSRLLRAFAQSGGARAVIAGSCAEYDWSGEGRLREGVTPIAPATLYGAAKHSLHVLADAFCARAGIRLAWGRAFFLYGPGEHPGRLVASLSRALVRGEPARCTSGEQVRDFLHVEEAGRAFAALTASDIDGAVNVGSGRPVAIREIASTLGRLSGRPGLVEHGALPSRPGEPPELVADTRRLREEVGFSSSISLEDGLAGTLDWWRARP